MWATFTYDLFELFEIRQLFGCFQLFMVYRMYESTYTLQKKVFLTILSVTYLFHIKYTTWVYARSSQIIQQWIDWKGRWLRTTSGYSELALFRGLQDSVCIPPQIITNLVIHPTRALLMFVQFIFAVPLTIRCKYLFVLLSSNRFYKPDGFVMTMSVGFVSIIGLVLINNGNRMRQRFCSYWSILSGTFIEMYIGSG